MKVKISCINARYWSGNNPDRFYLIVDIYKNGKGKIPDTYLYNSMSD